MHVALSSLDDERGVRAALRDRHGIPLVGVERWREGRPDADEVSHLDRLTGLAAQAGVRRFFYLSHLGADRASAYGLMKAKGVAEHIIRNPANYTIIRSSMVYGEGDNFTSIWQSLSECLRGLFWYRDGVHWCSPSGWKIW